MNLLPILLLAGITFGICFLIDKGFTGIFRNKAQHKTGRSVRANQRYGAFGLILFIMGIAALFTGLPNNWFFIIAGAVVMIVGICLVVYYMTFGIFYDNDSFVLTTFGKKSQVYRYRDIRCQQLYTSYGTVIIELQLYSGRTFQLQSGLIGVYPFLDTAFAGWCRQKGIQKEACAFHDPDNSCWFPKAEDC